MSKRVAQVRVPSYRLHRPSGRAVVTLAGRDHYLGDHGSAQSRREYSRLISEYLASNGAFVDEKPTVTQVIAAFWRHGARASGGLPQMS